MAESYRGKRNALKREGVRGKERQKLIGEIELLGKKTRDGMVRMSYIQFIGGKG